MDPGPDTPPEFLFKANKRRKIFRKRNASEENLDGRLEDTVPASASATGSSGDDLGDSLRVVRRPAAKKHGINFSSAEIPQEAFGPETALVPLSAVSGQEEQTTEIDRFVKPTGKIVVEDKHLTAYVDSKLAEFRSSHRTPTIPSPDERSQSPEEAGLGPCLDSLAGTAGAMTTSTATNKLPDSRRHGNSVNLQQRPTKQRRKGPTRDETAVARDNMVDQILRESEAPPHYRRPLAPPPLVTASTAADADEAAEQAFKARFLADLRDRNSRRKAAAAAASSKPAHTSHGPKLGGSRSQRGKMRAAQAEAKNAAAAGTVAPVTAKK